MSCAAPNGVETMDDDGLEEYRAVVEKVDAAVAALAARAGDALRCRVGCDACCAAGLSVLPVEATAIAVHLARTPPTLPPKARPDRCAFLDEAGACSIYPSRPLLCRTHGLALLTRDDDVGQRGLRVLQGDVSTCTLNYTERAPTAAEILDAEKVLALLVTVDQRFRARAGLSPGPELRVPLLALREEVG